MKRWLTLLVVPLAAILFATAVTQARAESLGGLQNVFYIAPGGSCAAVACTSATRRMCRDSATSPNIYACNTSTGFYVAVASAAGAGGSNTQVQINSGGNLAGDTGLTFNTSTDVLTMGGGVVVGGTFAGASDLTLANPAQAPSPATNSGTAGGCLTSKTYRFSYAWVNQSGQTTFGPDNSPDFTPSVNSKVTTLTRAETPPAGAVAWYIAYKQSSDAFANRKWCVAIGSHPEQNVYAVGTTTADCACSGTGIVPNTNTTGVISRLKVQPDGRITGAQEATTADKIATVDKNILTLRGTTPKWSADSGSTTDTLLAVGPNVLTVCPVGCDYAKPSLAVAAITDAGPSKRYAVFVAPAFYSDHVLMKSYISLVGLGSPADTRILADSTNAYPVGFVDGTQTEIGIFNLWASGGYGLGHINTPACAAPGTCNIYVHNCWLGATDGQDAFPTLAAMDDCSSCNANTYYITDSILRSPRDLVNFPTDNTYYLNSTQLIGNTSGIVDFVGGFYPIPGGGLVLIANDSVITLTDAGTSATDLVGIRTGPSSTRPVYVKWGGHVEINATSGSHSLATQAIHVTADGNTAGGLVDLTGADLKIVSAGSTDPLTGILVDASANHSNWEVVWNTGLSNISGGGTKKDVDNAETASGFKLRLGGVRLNQTVGGAGTACPGANCTTFAIDEKFGSFTNVLTIPGATTLPSTCTANRSIYVDTDAAPAGQQLYLCNATGNGWNLIGDGGAGAATDLNCSACVSASELTSAFVDAVSDFSSGFGTDGQILKKVSGAWALAADATGGAPSFDLITSNTNTTAAMVVGTGASMTSSGSGSIVATTGDSATAFFSSGRLDAAQEDVNAVMNDVANTFASAGTQIFNDPVTIEPDAVNGVTIDATGLLLRAGTGSVQADDVVCSGCVDLASEVGGALPAASVGVGLTDAQVSDTLTCSAVTQGAAPSLTTAGQVGVDSTADQLLWYSGSGVQVESATKEVCAIVPDLSASDDSFEFWTPPYPVHATAAGCYCRGTCSAALASFQFTNRAGTAMTGTPTCATGTTATTFTNLTGSTALVAGDGLRFNVTNSPLGSEGLDAYTICVKYTIDRQ